MTPLAEAQVGFALNRHNNNTLHDLEFKSVCPSDDILKLELTQMQEENRKGVRKGVEGGGEGRVRERKGGGEEGEVN